jgi:hypothetical protein
MDICRIYQPLQLQGAPKFTQIWEFWFESKPSGNPGAEKKQKIKQQKMIFFKQDKRPPLLDDFIQIFYEHKFCKLIGPAKRRQK